MRFLPHTESDLASMLAALHIERIDDLIAHLPDQLRAGAKINLAPGMSERDVEEEISALADRNRGASQFTSFLGAGYYRHYVPAAVRAIIGRAEFATAYTPYQPEASQGTLQAMFEFQTLVCQLTAMDVANASLYDGASAAAEAVLMARRMRPGRSVVALSRALWPDYRETIATYLGGIDGGRVVEVGFDAERGTTDIAAVRRLANDELLCLVTGYPNLFGIVEPLGELTRVAHDAGAISISVTAEALALGLLKPPGSLDVDIAAGEGQSFGLALEFGGPGLGFLGASQAYLRQMPGRLVGQTRDSEGRRAFCLALATREQHIRRERATSNICTNHSLCALAATVYLSLMGQRGIRQLAERNVELAHEAAARLAAAGLKLRFSAPFFNEFVVALDDPLASLKRAEKRGVLAGVALGGDYPELRDGLLISVTEMNGANDFDRLCEALRQG